MRKINVSINNFKLNNIKETDIYQAFLTYKNEGIIRCGDYSDNKWYLTDEYENCNFSFHFSKLDYDDFEENLGIGLDDMVDYLKAYVICKFGEVELTSLRQFICDMKKFFRLSYADLFCELEDVTISSLPKILDFLESLPDKGREEEMSYLKESISKNITVDYTDKKRLLASFDSYFKFNDLIELFWKECTDEFEKLFFFPVWFWWRVSSVYPMRPREVVLTPRNCLKKVNGRYQITVRKDKKKGNGKRKTYKIDTDYKTFSFIITDEFAKDIEWYIDKTSSYPDNELNTLFISDVHYKKWERCKPYKSRYFTYVNLNTCLRYFFEFVIHEYYGYELVSDLSRKHLNSNEIHKFNLGDTRHLSLIGVIFSGAPASVAQALASHDNVDMGAHYYTNIASFIETSTYRKYKKITSKEQFSLSAYRKPIEESFTYVTGGKCFSKKYAAKNYEDCSMACGPHGEVGYCSKCQYFRTSGRMFSTSDAEYKNMIECSCKSLQMAVDSLRKSKGYKEDITKGIIEINTLASEYSRYLMETKGE